MASVHLGGASLINESWVLFDSSLKLRIGFRKKRFGRVSERLMFSLQMSGNELRTKHELAKRSEALRRILKQYGVSVENFEENKTISKLDDQNHEDKQDTTVLSSVIDDSKMKTTEELPDLCRQEKYSETVSITEDLSGKNHQHNLKTGLSFTYLLPVLGFCIICIIGTLHTIISRKTSQDHHHHGSKRTRWRTALIDLNDPLASDEHDVPQEYRVPSANNEATDEMNEAYSKVELEYKRFLLDCGVSES